MHSHILLFFFLSVVSLCQNIVIFFIIIIQGFYFILISSYFQLIWLIYQHINIYIYCWQPVKIKYLMIHL